MKYLALIFLFCLVFNQITFCQINNIPILIGKTDLQVSSYLDSLNHLKSNPAYKIEKNVTDNGDLILEDQFSLNDERFYSCLAVITTFQRSKGIEYCVKQIVYGRTESSIGNLNFVKDNFKYVSENTWEFYYNNIAAKIVATFKKTKEGTSNFYSITYDLQEIE